MTVIETKDAQELSLDNCAKEPVHIPGHIQGFAVCLATDKYLTSIQYCSDNTESIFGMRSDEILGKSLNDLFSETTIHDLNNAFSLSSARVQRERASFCNFLGKDCELWVHYSNDSPVIEIETVAKESTTQSDAIRNVRSLLSHLIQTDNAQASFAKSVDGLRSLSGFDRVMLYQFDANGNGEIKAEAKGPGLESFLGLRFPSWDIPKQARDILKKVPLRIIADVNGSPVPLNTLSTNSDPLDLTFAACRGQSPVHSEYLRNMGVGSTMTLSILVQGELWGLFAFHHMSPRVIGPSLRGSAELFVQFFSLQLEQRLEKKRNITRTKTKNYENTILVKSSEAGEIIDLIDDVAVSLCELIEADGLAVIWGEQTSQHGSTPEIEVTRKIAASLLPPSSPGIFHTDSIVDLGVNRSSSAGALAFPIGQNNENSMVFFRNEAIASVTWAGIPEKEIVKSEDGPRLIPRGSFKAYAQELENRSLAWEQDSLTAAKELYELLAEGEIERLLKAGRQREIYINELNHRVKNILALIRSLVRNTTESSSSFETYAKSLEQRIAALGAAHDLSANQVTNGINIKTIFEMEAKPFLMPSNQLFITGPDFRVQPSAAPLFALITHELMTNCVKYGALSVPQGRVDITLKTDAHGVTIVWQESNGPATNPPTSNGFGLNLIKTSIPYELGGSSQLEFLHEGLTATFNLPLSLLDSKGQIDRKNITSNTQSTVDQKSALIIEDSLMIAMDLQEMLYGLGFETIEMSPTVDNALEVLSSFKPDFAILDIELREEQSFRVAEVLQQKEIAFCFVTGFASTYKVPEQFDDIKLLTKPLEQNILESTVSFLFSK